MILVRRNGGVQQVKKSDAALLGSIVSHNNEHKGKNQHNLPQLDFLWH